MTISLSPLINHKLLEFVQFFSPNTKQLEWKNVTTNLIPNFYNNKIIINMTLLFDRKIAPYQIPRQDPSTYKLKF
jgi:hypothetical protein